MKGLIDRIFLIVLDSFGVGELPDAALYGDAGSNTLRSVSKSRKFRAESLSSLGLFRIDGVRDWAGSLSAPTPVPCAAYARMAEKSRGKDTTTGHWEIAGLVSEKPFPVYPHGFPKEILDSFSKVTGRGILCNLPYSGTKVIEDYGDEHLKTGKLIVYTSADSVFQVAAHEELIPAETLYEYCRAARKILTGENAVGRVIARPFLGQSGHFYRTSRRHDFSLPPTGETMLDILKENGLETIGIGKISDIFAGRGLTQNLGVNRDNADGMTKLDECLGRAFRGLCFVNLVDFDMLYGHRNDADGYASAIAEFDDRLKTILPRLGKGDLLIVTADHGCDPSTPSTDHSREYVPLLLYGKQVLGKKSRNEKNVRRHLRHGARFIRIDGRSGDEFCRRDIFAINGGDKWTERI